MLETIQILSTISSARVGGSEKVQKPAHVIFEWSLRVFHNGFGFEAKFNKLKRNFRTVKIDIMTAPCNLNNLSFSMSKIRSIIL